MRHSKLLVSGLALLALWSAPRPAAAQSVGEFEVAPYAGAIRFDGSSALETAPVLGLDASYFVTERFGVGVQLNVARARTDGEFFPLVLLDFGDTTFVHKVSQYTTMVSAGALAQVQLPFERVNVSLNGGAGYYRFYLDPRRTQAVSRLSGPTISFGAGLEYKVSENVGIRADARDLVLLDYDREAFDATLSYVRNDRIPDILPGPPEAKDVIHNLRFALGFSFVPGRTR